VSRDPRRVLWDAIRFLRRRRLARHALTLFTAVATVAAVAGWTREPGERRMRAPSIAIRDIRPLQTDDANLRDLITHTFAVRVAVAGWRLVPYRPGIGPAGNVAGSGHWRLYVDGHPLGDTYGPERVSYTPYLPPGTHWIAAELSNADSTSLRTPVWSEPVVLNVPHGAIPDAAGTRAVAAAAPRKEKP
jgi:hypothetical protein